MSYGEPPVVIGEFDLSNHWQEFMHYLYLPVLIPGQGRGIAVPERLSFLHPVLAKIVENILTHRFTSDWTLNYFHMYVTARRGYATAENPLNRPGWHCDDFGGTDINYIWTDKYPTRFITQDVTTEECFTARFVEQNQDGSWNVPNDHIKSVEYFDLMAKEARWENYGLSIKTYPPNTLLRLNPYVIHATPEITDGGGLRSFFKISISDKKYNLLGNSHNYLLDYDWKMYPRDEIRNDPHYAGTDYYEEKS